MTPRNAIRELARGLAAVRALLESLNNATREEW